MLKIVGTEKGKVVDEKVLLDDQNRPTKFMLFLLGIELLFDVGLICLLYTVLKKSSKSTNQQYTDIL